VGAGYSRVTHPFAARVPPKGLTARLACVKHAASVRPEPGSNSPLTSTNCVPKDLRPSTVDPDKLITCQRNPSSTGRGPDVDGALNCSSSTFGTLLSSQGSRAHRLGQPQASRSGATVLPYRARAQPVKPALAPLCLILGSTRVLVHPRGQIRFRRSRAPGPRPCAPPHPATGKTLGRGSNLSQIPGGWAEPRPAHGAPAWRLPAICAAVPCSQPFRLPPVALRHAPRPSTTPTDRLPLRTTRKRPCSRGCRGQRVVRRGHPLVVHVGPALLNRAPRLAAAGGQPVATKASTDARQAVPSPPLGRAAPPRGQQRAPPPARGQVPRPNSACAACFGVPQLGVAVYQGGHVCGQHPLGHRAEGAARARPPCGRSPPATGTRRPAGTCHHGVLGVQPELVEGVRAHQLRVEPQGPGLGLAVLRPVGLGDQWRGQRVHLGTLARRISSDAGGDVAPLVTAAALQPAAVPRNSSR
jgi:hypothetical protein